MKWSTHVLLALCWLVVGLNVAAVIPPLNRPGAFWLLGSLAFALGMHWVATVESREDSRE